MAHIAQDQVWFDALKNDKDLHSICASLVFGKEWENAAEPNCAFVANQMKCKCKKHKPMRDKVKTVSFGLCYGMSKFRLSATLKITLAEAELLMLTYYKAFPRIRQVLLFLEKFGIQNGYIQTLYPFYRRRVFPQWQLVKGYVQGHLSGDPNMYNSTLGEIGRQSMNMPIQGASGDMIKLAMIKMYRWIRENNYRDQIKLVLNVHDQLTSICKDELVPLWLKEKDRLMCDAAKEIIPSGILKADTQSSKFWTK